MLWQHVVLCRSCVAKSAADIVSRTLSAFAHVLEFSVGATESSAGKKLESIYVFGCRLELADGPIAIPDMRFISFFRFLFLDPDHVFNPRRRSIPKPPLFPSVSSYSMLHAPLQFSNPPPPIPNTNPFPSKNLPFYSFRPHSRKSRYQEMEIVLARILSALKPN